MTMSNDYYIKCIKKGKDIFKNLTFAFIGVTALVFILNAITKEDFLNSVLFIVTVLISLLGFGVMDEILKGKFLSKKEMV